MHSPEPLAHNSSIESQTDEIKAEQQQNQATENQPAPVAPVKVPCVADTVLQHYPTMIRLLGSLSQSTSTSFALLATSLRAMNTNDTCQSIGDPATVADAVFQILMLLSQKATQPTLVIKPLYDFLKSSKATTTFI